MLAFVDLEERVPQDHPIRTIKIIADEALERLSPEFNQMYSKVGRASVISTADDALAESTDTNDLPTQNELAAWLGRATARPRRWQRSRSALRSCGTQSLAR